MGCSLLAPVAADPLTDRHDRLQQAISRTKQDMSESSHAAAAAALALTKAQNALSDAEARLRRTRAALAIAQHKDAALAAKLKAQQAALARAKAAVAAGERKLAAQKAMVGAIVRNQFQRQSDLLPLAMLTTSTSMGDLEKRVQLSRTMLDTNQAEFDQLTVLQTQLDAQKAEQARLEQQVAADKDASARNVAAKQKLAQQAARQQASVAALVTQRQSAQAAAARAAAADKAHYAGLQKEDAAVQQRIAARIARQKAAAARARARAAAQARAAARARSAARTRGRQHAAWAAPASHHGFIYPAQGPITSPFGMRMHPILHVWKLHDGTDFGVGCGAPIYAPYPGRVVERYYNVGYGNRLIIDHGRVDGHYITTAMNHAVRYTVGVGAHVRKGQVIGYVGETGYATGCHLHLMVWEDGNLINPMTWY